MQLDKESFLKNKHFSVFNQNSKFLKNKDIRDFNNNFTDKIINKNIYGNGQFIQDGNNTNSIFDELYQNNIELIVDIILYVIVVVNILTILFFTLVKDVEKQIVQTQIDNILDSILVDEKSFGETVFNNESSLINK